MQQVDDFAQECTTLDALLQSLHADDWTRSTQFKSWTVNDVMVHLHYWNRMAHWSWVDEARFDAELNTMMQGIAQGSMRAVENAAISERGAALRDAWRAHLDAMLPLWRDIDPKARLKWAGPSMSARSSITARQMETWAHSQAIFDLKGVEREESDRIQNIVVLGVNTFAWTFQARQQTPPGPMPQLVLSAPSGAEWTYGEAQDDNRISGSAVDFARVVTQTRHVQDTALQVSGAVAQTWMANAQCFAGPPNDPPPPGTRYVQTH